MIDLIIRVDVICKKYDKYNVDKQRDLNVAGDEWIQWIHSFN